MHSPVFDLASEMVTAAETRADDAVIISDAQSLPMFFRLSPMDRVHASVFLRMLQKPKKVCAARASRFAGRRSKK
jgi:hypothetical protein